MAIELLRLRRNSYWNALQLSFGRYAAATDLDGRQMIDDLRRIVNELVATQDAPVTVALDGPSGAGKSTIARALAISTAGVLVPSDDFFAAQLTRAEWDARTPMERARDAIDWSRLRRCAIEPLRAGQRATWHSFDFGAGER